MKLLSGDKLGLGFFRFRFDENLFFLFFLCSLEFLTNGTEWNPPSVAGSNLESDPKNSSFDVPPIAEMS